MSLLLKYWVRYASILDQVLRYAFVILFVYAGMSKLLDFETFQVQLAQSPLLSAYAGFVAWAVPLSEFLIAILLLVDRTRVWGLSGFFFLMVMFTTYIIIILNFADFIPCSCGGVLEKMSWGQHLVFNVVFVLVSGLLLFFQFSGNWRRRVLLLGSQVVLGVGVVSVLFAFSEKKMHRNNAFVRRYVPHPVTHKENEIDVKYNSYYFAGIDQKKIYLGNITAPAHLLIVNKSSQDTIFKTIHLPHEKFVFQNLKTLIIDSTFYSYDGISALVLKGDTNNFKVKNTYNISQPFLRAAYSGIDTFAIRSFDSKTTKNMIGTLSLSYTPKLEIAPNLLIANNDPFFDTDGLLLYNSQMKKIIYVYFYRNEFVVSDLLFLNYFVEKTVDTVSRPKYDVHLISKKNQRGMGKQPITINSLASTYGDYLFIQSDRLGKFESDDIKNSAFIIDVYNLSKRSYSFSFYLYHNGLKTLREFKVDSSGLYILADHYLITYKLDINSFIN